MPTTRYRRVEQCHWGISKLILPVNDTHLEQLIIIIFRIETVIVTLLKLQFGIIKVIFISNSVT